MTMNGLLNSKKATTADSVVSSTLFLVRGEAALVDQVVDINIFNKLAGSGTSVSRDRAVSLQAWIRCHDLPPN